jgi:hypothetical protein
MILGYQVKTLPIHFRGVFMLIETIGNRKLRFRAFPVKALVIKLVIDTYIPGGWNPKDWISEEIPFPFKEELREEWGDTPANPLDLFLKNVIFNAVPLTINEVGAVTLQWRVMGPMLGKRSDWSKTQVYSSPALTAYLYPQEA